MAPLLSFSRVCAGYGATTVLENVSFALEPASSLALLGRNGMGKSTLLATIMGATQLHRGVIELDGTSLARVAAHRRPAMGLGWVPQDRGIFRSLSVKENLEVAARPGKWTLQRVYELFPRLAEREGHMGTQLSGGEQQMLAIARALMLNSRLLLLDEPLEGLAPAVAEQLLATIKALCADDGLSVILVEQHARQALQITRQALVLNRGQVVYDGASSFLLGNESLLYSLVGVGPGN
nr:ABC transporter ATP-binding protein [Pseudomonas sp.]